MDNWLAALSFGDRVLDLGSGAGSFDYTKYACRAVAVDIDIASLRRAGGRSTAIAPVNASSHLLPFNEGCFDLVVCHHTFEHFPNIRETLAEIGRVLSGRGRVYVAVPNGYGFDDRLYRYLLEGGGHVNRFRFSELVELVAGLAEVQLVGHNDLHASFVYLHKPSAEVLPHLRPRFRRLARLPGVAFFLARFVLNVLTRLTDRLCHRGFSVYGWALYFQRGGGEAVHMPDYLNVCMHCGAGHPAASLSGARRYRLFYRCPACRGLNPYFRPTAGTV